MFRRPRNHPTRGVARQFKDNLRRLANHPDALGNESLAAASCVGALVRVEMASDVLEVNAKRSSGDVRCRTLEVQAEAHQGRVRLANKEGCWLTDAPRCIKPPLRKRLTSVTPTAFSSSSWPLILNELPKPIVTFRVIGTASSNSKLCSRKLL